MPHDGLESVARVRAPETETSIDALADLFLGEALRHDERPAHIAGRIGGDAPALSAPTGVEVIVLGQLPVLASAWAAQYARTQSERLGRPVCLARLTERTATIELVGDPRAPESHDTLESAVTHARAHAHGWIVLTELDAGTVAGLEDVPAITVLTGSDDAAVVGCYTTLKSIVEARGSMQGLAVRVAIMGASEADAKDARERIERAAHRFLDLQPVVVVVPTISPAPTCTLYRGQSSVDGGGLLSLVTRAASHREPAPSAEPKATATIEPPARFIDAPETGPTPHEGEARTSSIDGLDPLPMRCPYAPGVELAVGRDGGLHAIADGALDAVEQLLVASAWTDDHAELLEAADDRIDPGAACVMHLMTSDPHRAARLLSTSIRVHVTNAAGEPLDSWLANPQPR